MIWSAPSLAPTDTNPLAWYISFEKLSKPQFVQVKAMAGALHHVTVSIGSSIRLFCVGKNSHLAQLICTKRGAMFLSHFAVSVSYTPHWETQSGWGKRTRIQNQISHSHCKYTYQVRKLWSSFLDCRKKCDQSNRCPTTKWMMPAGGSAVGPAKCPRRAGRATRTADRPAAAIEPKACCIPKETEK